MGITASPSKYLLAGGAATQPSHREGIFQGFFFPVARNGANLLFVSHMGSQMDGEVGVGCTDSQTDRSARQDRQQQAVLAG